MISIIIIVVVFSVLCNVPCSCWPLASKSNEHCILDPLVIEGVIGDDDEEDTTKADDDDDEQHPRHRHHHRHHHHHHHVIMFIIVIVVINILIVVLNLLCNAHCSCWPLHIA